MTWTNTYTTDFYETFAKRYFIKAEGQKPLRQQSLREYAQV